MLGVLGAVAVGIGWTWFDREILSTLPPELGRNTDFRFPCSVQVFATDGTKVDSFHLERRVWVPIGELPPHVWQAFVASEDRRFFAHEGVDPLGIARALVVNLQGGETRQGGSTITQQLVKNLLVGKERSYRRKLREAVLAYRLDDELSKMELLELYINYIALGSGNYGVEAAAQDFFGISARNLDVGQAAMLAGLVPAPSRYSPRHDPELAAQRRETVLKLMVAQGYTTAEEASQRLADPVLVPRQSPDKGARAAYLTEVRREVRRVFSAETAYLQGLQVHTPLDVGVQKVVEDAVREGLLALEARQGARAPTRNIPEGARAAYLARGDGLRLDPQTSALREPRPSECFPAIASDSEGMFEAGNFRARLHADDLATLVRVTPSKAPVPLAEVLTRGDVLEVCVSDAPSSDGVLSVRRKVRPWAESAAVVLENATGHVVALSGGYDVGLEGFIRATQARRQPGSSFKPFVYATALAGGLRQDSVVVDAPFSVLGTNGRPWTPHNYDGSYKGAIQLRSALALSLNTVAVRLIHQFGVDRVATLAHDLGVRSPLRSDLTLALGSSEVTPMDLAVGYSSLARMGVRIDPVWITSVEDRRGRPLGHEGGAIDVPDATLRALPGGPGTRVMDPATAYVMVDMMRNVVRAGTAKKAQREGMDFAGKTGTTSGFMDAWFVGYSPRYTVAVWVGTDGTASLGDKETGGKAALPVWSRIMDALPNVAGERFPVPAGVVLLPAAEEKDGATLWLGYARGRLPDGRLAVPALREGDVLPPFGGSYPVARPPESETPELLPVEVAALESLPDDDAADLEVQAYDVESAALDEVPGSVDEGTWVEGASASDGEIVSAAPSADATPASLTRTPPGKLAPAKAKPASKRKKAASKRRSGKAGRPRR